MQIIRDKERQAQAVSSYRAHHRVEAAIDDLRGQKDDIVEKIVATTRDSFVRSNMLVGSVGISGFPYTYELVGNTDAEALIATWLKEYDPSLKPDVRITYVRDHGRVDVLVTFTAV